jgi:di/tricarboxylate transporter
MKAAMGVAGLFGDEISNVATTGLAELNQTYEDRFRGKQRYFAVVTYGPQLYGLALMIVLGLFPVAAMFALCPGQWKTFVNYGKVLMSVKIWPMGWCILSTFNQRRGALEAFDPPERIGGSPFLAVSAMYLVVPAVSFLIVHLAATAAAIPFAAAVPPAAGPGSGPVAPAAAVASRAAR